jgi:hypothetical protein
MPIDKPFVIVVKYTLIEASRRRFVLLYATAILLSIVISLYAASLSMLEKQQTMAAFYGFSVRLFGAGLVAAWVIMTEARSLDQAHSPLFFSLPLGRTQYLLARLCGYAAVAAVAQLAVTLPLLALPVSTPTVLAWAASAGCELLIVVMLALTLVLIFPQPVACLFLFAVIYLFARCSGEFWRHSDALLSGQAALGEQIIAWPLKLITYLVPRLEDFAGASWLLRDAVPDMTLRNVTLETAIYVALLLAIAVERIRRRVF